MISKIHLFNIEKKDAIEQEQALKRACQEFEAFFIYYMLKVMRKTIPKTELFYGGLAEDIYTSLLDEQLANEVSKVNSLGLAKLLYEQLSRLKTSELFQKVADNKNIEK